MWRVGDDGTYYLPARDRWNRPSNGEQLLNPLPGGKKNRTNRPKALERDRYGSLQGREDGVDD